MVGRKIGQFQIEEELGVGGMGTVYKAKDTRLNRYVAIKALHPHVLRDSQAFRRFKNEAQISAQLSNPNVAILYDFIKENDQNYLIMEYIDGVTIEERLKREGALSVGETISLSKQILGGLSEAHRLNILHRDLKPANVMIKAGNYAKLMDFGIARLETATRLTAHNKVIGTVEYMAPELLKGKEPSKASDLYAVGVLIYEMLTGKTLFVANSEAALVYSIVNDKPKLDLSGVPPELRRIVKKLTNKLPQNRYWNTEKVLSDLEKVYLVTDIKDDNFSRQISYPLYNIIFEMINNILKHSQAKNAWVSISRTENEKINISVNDDGIGFYEDNFVKGYGLKNITARVDNLNGHWQIESAPKKGTKIMIEIPDMY